MFKYIFIPFLQSKTNRKLAAMLKTIIIEIRTNYELNFLLSNPPISAINCLQLI